MMWPVDLRTSLWPQAGLAFDRSMADLLCHRSFFSCKDNTLNVWINNNNNNMAINLSMQTVQRWASPWHYVCMVTHIARVWINRVRLPVLHVVGWTGKMNISLSAFVPENLISLDGFGSPVPRQPAHLRPSSPYSGWIWYLLTEFLPSSAAASIYLIKTAIRHRVSPEFIGSRNCVPMAFTAESPPARGQ